MGSPSPLRIVVGVSGSLNRLVALPRAGADRPVLKGTDDIPIDGLAITGNPGPGVRPDRL
ncbi:hypothetical protein AB0I54_28655 [Streptomyces sp. NPDC050625]|uniref:hypothetical protein n=1 Tax=Streptomyces sp. NPDC050625 TaxID=3154629 RepID=UPI00343C51BE